MKKTGLATAGKDGGVGFVRLTFLVAAVGMLLPFAGTASAERRVALVIGNGSYSGELALKNPVNDATDVSAALSRLDFDVIFKTDLDKAGMDSAFGAFAVAVEGADVALFYYAGHATELDGHNYLMPLGAKLESEASVPYELARVDDVLSELRRASGVRIAVLDACRDNPLADGLKSRSARSRSARPTRGLARIENSEGMMIAFATQPGATAADGQQRNSPFTSAFLRNVETPGLEVGQLFRRIAKDVYDATDKAQLPELSISLLGEFYLKRRGGPAPPIDKAEVEWSAVQDSDSILMLEDFIKRHPESVYANLAKTRIDEIGWKNVRSSNSIVVLSAFVRDNPDSIYANTAQARIEEIAWQSVADSDSVASLQDFVRSYPESIYVNNAKIRIEELSWKDVKDSEDIPTIRHFIGQFPDSIYANYARIRIDELTPEPEPEEEEVLAIYADVDFYGGDIATVSASDLTRCAQACADDGRCRYFTFVQKNNSCILKSSYDMINRFYGATSGQYVIGSSGGDGARVNVEWEIHIGRDYAGNDFEALRVGSLDQCLRACDRNGSCNAFSFAPKIQRKDNCWLKYSAGALLDNGTVRSRNIGTGRRVSETVSPMRVVRSQ